MKRIITLVLSLTVILSSLSQSLIAASHFSSPSGRSAEKLSFTAHVEEFGQLRRVIGDRLTYIDSLTVIGPIHPNDFHVMYHGALRGCLRVINLENASFYLDEVPDNAFYNEREQDDGSTFIRLTNLRRVILPDGTRRIGANAFANTNVEHVNLPESLEEIGTRAFCSANLKGQLVIPPKITQIPVSAFRSNKELEEIIFHSDGVREIKQGAFSDLYSLRRLELPEGLRILGGNAFANAKVLEYLYIPSTLDSVPPMDGGPFYVSVYSQLIKQVKIADGIKRIPAGLLSGIRTNWLTLPESVTEIGDQGCYSKYIKGITFSPNLRKIGNWALPSSLNLAVLPATIESIGTSAFSGNLKALYCLNPEPPRAVYTLLSDEDLESGNYSIYITAFSGVKKDIPVYIPKGSLQNYSRKPYNKGWELLTNFIELDEMPTLDAGVGEIRADMEDNVRIFPISGGVMIETSAERMPYIIHTVDGRACTQGTVYAGSIHIPLSSGIYIVRAGTKTSKIIL